MERCKSVEEILKSGERTLVFHCEQKELMLDWSNLFKLIIKLGNVSEISDYFKDNSIDEIKYFLNKHKINFNEV